MLHADFKEYIASCCSGQYISTQIAIEVIFMTIINFSIVFVCSRYKKALWETNPDYCDKVKETPPFNEGRVLIDLIELHIFDFLQGETTANVTVLVTYLPMVYAKYWKQEDNCSGSLGLISVCKRCVILSDWISSYYIIIYIILIYETNVYLYVYS